MNSDDSHENGNGNRHGYSSTTQDNIDARLQSQFLKQQHLHSTIIANDERLNKEVDELFGLDNNICIPAVAAAYAYAHAHAHLQSCSIAAARIISGDDDNEEKDVQLQSQLFGQLLLHTAIIANDERLNKEVDELFGLDI